MNVESPGFFTCYFGISYPVEELKEISVHQEILTDSIVPLIALYPLTGYKKRQNLAQIAPLAE